MRWVKTTETEYWDRLGALPPRARGPLGAFLMGEPVDQRGGVDTWQAYREPTPGWFEKSAKPVTIAEFRAEMERGGIVNA